MDGELIDDPSRRRVLRRLASIAAATAVPGAVSAAVANAQWSRSPRKFGSDYFIIDGVVHCYNHDLSNYKRPDRIAQGASYGYDVHARVNPAPYRLSPEQWLHDWQPDEVAEQLFLESDTDMMCMHSVPLFFSYRDGLVSNPKGAYLKSRYPDRVVWYAAIDLFDPWDTVQRTVDWVVSQGADGIKLYPNRIDHESGRDEYWFMDDPKRAFPLFEYAISKGIRHFGCHKVIGYNEAKTPYLGIQDFAGAAAAFPHAFFHLVHAGWLLMDETVALMAKYPNITAVMEGPMFWPRFDMPQFERLVRQFINRVDSNRVLYASAAANQHPYWILNDFVSYERPAADPAALTRDHKAKILGKNFAALHGIDIVERRNRLAKDRFSAIKNRDGLREPFVMQRMIKKAASGLRDPIVPYGGAKVY